MQKNKFLSMLGIAKRAGALLMGHDAAVGAIFSGKAKLMLLASDLSERAKRDIKITVQKHNARLPVIEADITIAEIGAACGYKAGILAVSNAEMSKKLISLANE